MIQSAWVLNASTHGGGGFSRKPGLKLMPKGRALGLDQGRPSSLSLWVWAEKALGLQDAGPKARLGVRRGPFTPARLTQGHCLLVPVLAREPQHRTDGQRRARGWQRAVIPSPWFTAGPEHSELSGPEPRGCCSSINWGESTECLWGRGPVTVTTPTPAPPVVGLPPPWTECPGSSQEQWGWGSTEERWQERPHIPSYPQCLLLFPGPGNPSQPPSCL